MSHDPGQFSNPASAFQSAIPLHPQPGQPTHSQQRHPRSIAPPIPAAGLGSSKAHQQDGRAQSGLSFEHILSCLQSGLLSIDPSVCHQPGPIHSYPQSIPPVRPHMPDASSHQPSHATVPSHQLCPTPALETLASLQAQLSEFQSTLTAHVEKICALEKGLANEADLAKSTRRSSTSEVRMLRNMISKGQEAEREEDGGSEGDEDETRSVATGYRGR